MKKVKKCSAQFKAIVQEQKPKTTYVKKKLSKDGQDFLTTKLQVDLNNFIYAKLRKRFFI